MPMMPSPRRRLPAWLLLAPLFATAVSFAAPTETTAPPEPPRDEIVQLEPHVVSGVQPGPGLWKVRRDGHEMVVLGTVRPLPKRMTWESDGVVEAISRSQLVLLSPSVKLDADVGFFGGLFLLPAMLKATKNPDGGKLAELVPAEDYARWLRLKKRFIGNERSVEKRRPLFAANKLYAEALDATGLTHDSPVSKAVSKAVKQFGIAVERPRIEIKVANPKETLREFAQSGLDDAACFHGMLDHVERDLPALRARALAWAQGDVDALRNIPLHDASNACMDAVLETKLAEHLGIADVRERIDAMWLEKAQAALRDHETTFALLPMTQVLGEDGYLAKLQALGYEIEAP